MRFSDGVPVAPYCFICRRRGATRARATDLLAVRGSQRGVLKPLQVSPSCSRCRLGSAREGKLTTRTLGTCSVDNAAAVLDEAAIASVLQVASSFLRRELSGRCLTTRFIFPSHSCAALAAPGLNETAPRRRAVHLPRVAPCLRLATRARASEPPQPT